jgi:hypothetical protein
MLFISYFRGHAGCIALAFSGKFAVAKARALKRATRGQQSA